MEVDEIYHELEDCYESKTNRKIMTTKVTVARITSTKRGKGYAYNFVSTEDVWYGHGFTKPKFNEGATIEFDYVPNGNFKNVVEDSVVVLEEGTPPEPSQRKRGSTENWDARAKYWDDKDKRDQANDAVRRWHAASAEATSVARLLIETGAYKLPSKQADQYDHVMELRAELIGQFFAASGAVFENNLPE